jgi:hypothetical protein
MVPVERKIAPLETAYANLLSNIKPGSDESNAMMISLASAMEAHDNTKASDIITAMLPKFSGPQRDALKALRYELSK